VWQQLKTGSVNGAFDDVDGPVTEFCLDLLLGQWLGFGIGFGRHRSLSSGRSARASG
jgi:hypothetical protein